MSTLLLLRHGQAAFGAEHYDQLSELGLAQAQASGLHWASRRLRLDAIYSGPRQRQRLSAQAVMQQLPSPPLQIEAALDEFADAEQILAAAERRSGIAVRSDPQFSMHEKRRLYAEQIRLWSCGEDRIDGAPDAQSFRLRCRHWLYALQADPQRSRQILAVSSAGVIAALVCETLKLPDSTMADFMHVLSNASITTIKFSRQRCSLESFNQTGHLTEDLLTGL